MTILEEFEKRRDEGNKRISEQNFLPLNRFMALDSRTYEEGAIPARYKELMGLVASMVLRCNDCILYHIKEAVAKGCNESELIESMNIALVVGGSIVIPHLRHALAAVELFFPKAKTDG